jgi:hypothetical protein
MKPLEFLAAVLPSAGHGHYCVAKLGATRKEHRFSEDTSAFRPQIKKWLEHSGDVYFALATFEDPSKGRKAVNARYVRSLFIDMDGYDSKRAAGEALGAFLSSTGLDAFGTPHIVASGGGLHCYWPLSEDADIDTWKPVAENFKRLCRQEGLDIDMTVTADAARVLRVPGTLNFKKKYKTPQPVKILTAGNALVDLRKFGATVRSLLKDAAPASNNFVPTGLDIAGTRPTRQTPQKSALNEALMGNSVTRFETIWLKSEKGVGCAQLDYYMHNAKQDGMEPLWRGFLSLAKVCEDAEAYTRKLSDLHPYPHSRMQQKLAEIKGPYPCVKLDSENPGVCSGCPHWGSITNPLALGREVAIDNKPKQIMLPVHTSDDAEEAPQRRGGHDVAEELDEDDSPAAAVVRVFERPAPPKGFDYGTHGGIYRIVEITDSTGVKSNVQVPVLPYDLYVVDTLRMEAREMHAHLMAVRPVGEEDDNGEREREYIPIILPHKTAIAQDELLKVLATHGVLASHGKVNDRALFDYVRGSLAIATQAKRAVEVPIQFGWQKDRSFVYNNRVFMPNGSVIPVPMPGLENINRVTNTKGTLDGWRKFWNLMIERKMYTMLAMCVDAFGSTLMHFSEYEGFVWHIGSTESGTGKSLTLTAKAGVWGHPIRYRTGKGTSQVAMQQRAGLLNSLPLLIDEITTRTRADTEWTPEFIFNISEGQGKERMESGTNKERVNNTTWALTCTMTSNTHMIDILTSARKHSSNGEVMRMLEWTPNEQLHFTEEEHVALRALRQNYGVAGEVWARWIVQNYELTRDVWQQVHRGLRDKFNFSDEERYWHAATTSSVTAAILMGDKYTELLPLMPVRHVGNSLHELVKKARIHHVKAARTADDVLNAYTRDNYGKFVIVRRDELGEMKTDLGLDAATRHSTRGAVMGRAEIGLKDGTVEYFIEEQLLRQHCASMSFGYADFKAQMQAIARGRQAKGSDYRVKFDIRKNLLALTDGPELRVRCMQLTVPKEAFDADGTVALG